jgi:hypothetical protein
VTKLPLDLYNPESCRFSCGLIATVVRSVKLAPAGGRSSVSVSSVTV